MCLCGMLAAEFETLPKAMQTALDGFFALNERWLVSVLEEGRSDGTLHFKGTVSEAAQYIIGSLEGSMMMAGPAAAWRACSNKTLPSEFRQSRRTLRRSGHAVKSRPFGGVTTSPSATLERLNNFSRP